MNNTISVYELLGLIKDGKAPKMIKYKDNNYIFTGYDYHCILTNIEKGFVEYRLIKNYIQDLQSILNEKVEILEEDKPIIEKLNLDREPLRGREVPRAIDYLLEGRINEIIDYINKEEADKK